MDVRYVQRRLVVALPSTALPNGAAAIVTSILAIGTPVFTSILATGTPVVTSIPAIGAPVLAAIHPVGLGLGIRCR